MQNIYRWGRGIYASCRRQQQEMYLQHTAQVRPDGPDSLFLCRCTPSRCVMVDPPACAAVGSGHLWRPTAPPNSRRFHRAGSRQTCPNGDTWAGPVRGAGGPLGDPQVLSPPGRPIALLERWEWGILGDGMTNGFSALKLAPESLAYLPYFFFDGLDTPPRRLSCLPMIIASPLYCQERPRPVPDQLYSVFQPPVSRGY